LADRGLKEAPKMGKRLDKRDVKPDLLLSSPALRALTTAQLIADEIGYEREDIVVDDRLYASSADTLLAVVRALDKKLERVMLFGHNPEFAELAHRLSSEIVDMPTCAVAEFRFDTTKWSDVGRVEPSQSTLDQPGK
jgi:phosphohistidine phosphatase